MSKLAMHVEHYKRGSIGAIEQHDLRTGATHSNEDIDPDRSENNIQILTPENGSLYATVMEAAEASTGRITANSVLLSSWVIYPPEDIQDPKTADPEELRRWGNDVVEWMRSKQLHPQAATIHLDETTAHMHVETTPITADGRFSRKELYTRAALANYHTELAEFLADKGWDVQRGEKRKPGEKGKSKTVREYKAWAEDEKSRLGQEIDQLYGTITQMNDHIDEQQRVFEENKALLADLDADIDDAEAWIRSHPGLAEEIARSEELRRLRAAARDLQQKEQQIQALLKDREAAIETIREDLQARIDDYVALKERKREAYKARSDAAATVEALEDVLEESGMVKGIIVRIALCGARKQAEEAAERHDKLCAAVRAQKHKIQHEQKRLQRESAELDKLLKEGAAAALQPQKERKGKELQR